MNFKTQKEVMIETLLRLTYSGIISSRDDLTTVTRHLPDHVTVETQFGVGPKKMATITWHPERGASVVFVPDIQAALEAHDKKYTEPQ
jgi:hypothetical protein